MNKRYYKLKTILVGPGVFITTGLVTIFAVISITSNYSSAKNQLTTKQTTIINLFTGSISDSLLSGQYKDVYTQCIALSKNSDISSISIVGFNKQSICDYSDNKSTLWVQNLKKEMYFSSSKKEVAGHVSIGFRQDQLKGQINNLILLYLALSISIVFLHVLFYHFLSLAIASPISQLLGVLNKSKSKQKDLNSIIGIKELASLKSRTLEHLSQIEEYQKKLVANEKQRALSMVARQVAHDIRSPISALNVLKASMKSLDTEQKQMLDTVVKRITNIADDLLKTSKTPNNGKIRTTVRSFEEVQSSLKSLCAELGLRSKIENIGIIFESTPEDSISIEIDLGILNRIISNLVNNAIEASQPGQFVSVSCTTRKNVLQIVIEDRGSGMAEEVLGNLGKCEVASFKNNGSGIGVLYAFDQVSNFNGIINVQSKLKIGTTFTIDFPSS